MKRRTVIIRVYEADRDFIKENMQGSMADVIHYMIWKKEVGIENMEEDMQEKMREEVRKYMEEKVQPYIKKKIEEMSIKKERDSNIENGAI